MIGRLCEAERRIEGTDGERDWTIRTWRTLRMNNEDDQRDQLSLLSRCTILQSNINCAISRYYRAEQSFCSVLLCSAGSARTYSMCVYTTYLVSSSAGLSSTWMSPPCVMVRSRVVVGTAAKKGTLWYLAAMASWYVPILFAVSLCRMSGIVSVIIDK